MDMNDLENRLFELMSRAEIQQTAIDDALAALARRQAELSRASEQLQANGRALAPSLEQATRKAVETAIQNKLAEPAQALVQVLETVSRPMFASLGKFEHATHTATEQLQNAVRGFGWRWAVLAGGIAVAVVLCLFLAVEGLLWWDRSQMAELRGERDRLAEEVSQARQALDILNKKTGGVRYVVGSDGRFLLIPAGYEPGWTCNGEAKTPCIKLK